MHDLDTFYRDELIFWQLLLFWRRHHQGNIDFHLDTIKSPWWSLDLSYHGWFNILTTDRPSSPPTLHVQVWTRHLILLGFALAWVQMEIGRPLHLHPRLRKTKFLTLLLLPQLSLVLFHRVQQLTQPASARTFLVDESHVFCLAEWLGAAQLWPVRRPHNLHGGHLLLLRIGR